MHLNLCHYISGMGIPLGCIITHDGWSLWSKPMALHLCVWLRSDPCQFL